MLPGPAGERSPSPAQSTRVNRLCKSEVCGSNMSNMSNLQRRNWLCCFNFQLRMEFIEKQSLLHGMFLKLECSGYIERVRKGMYK